MAKTKVTMPDDLKSKCAAVIHTATTAAAAAGIIPIPMADTIPITGAQMTMIMGLAKVFDIPMTQAAAQSILGGTMASQAGRTIFSNIIKGIPGVGTVVGGVISVGTSVALTETLGWIVAEDFYKQSIGLGSDSPLEGAKDAYTGFSDFAKSVNTSQSKKKHFSVF